MHHITAFHWQKWRRDKNEVTAAVFWSPAQPSLCLLIAVSLPLFVQQASEEHKFYKTSFLGGDHMPVPWTWATYWTNLFGSMGNFWSRHLYSNCRTISQMPVLHVWVLSVLLLPLFCCCFFLSKTYTVKFASACGVWNNVMVKNAVLSMVLLILNVKTPWLCQSNITAEMVGEPCAVDTDLGFSKLCVIMMLCTPLPQF